MKNFLLPALLVVSLVLPFSGARAAGVCYTPAEAEAEQGIRIHSELMVIGLNCQNMKFTDGTDLYAKYRAFTAARANLFADYETRLMDYFRRTGDGNPEASLNALRTNFANRISLDATKMQPHVFCNSYAGRIIKASSLSENALRNWAATVYPGHPVSQPICSH